MRGKDNGNDIDLSFGDFGNIEIPDIDASLFDVLGDSYDEETRYTKPRVYGVKSDYVMYDNALKLARELRLDKGQRADVIVGGDFIFGDFIEAYVARHNAKCLKMTISTLSLNQNNVDSLRNLLAGNFVDELNLIVSVYFWGNEARSLIPYIYRKLDIGDKFQLAVASVHTKTAQFETLGGTEDGDPRQREPAQQREHRAIHDRGESRIVRFLRRVLREDHRAVRDYQEAREGEGPLGGD